MENWCYLISYRIRIVELVGQVGRVGNENYSLLTTNYSLNNRRSTEGRESQEKRLNVQRRRGNKFAKKREIWCDVRIFVRSQRCEIRQRFNQNKLDTRVSMRRCFVGVRVSNNLRINNVSVQAQRKASQIAHHQKCHKHAYKMLNFTTLHFSKFRNAKLQKKS